jgi:hypothetical protein
MRLLERNRFRSRSSLGDALEVPGKYRMVSRKLRRLYED